MDLSLCLRILLLAVLMLGACAPVPRHPESTELEGMPILAGVVNGTAVFSGEVYMPGDVLVPRGSTLVLRPGTIVYVRPAESTKIDPEYLSSMTELLVLGSLRVEGTARRPVHFVPLTVPQSGEPAWAGIALVGASSSSILGARIHHAESAILLIDTSPEIRGNHLQFNRYGILVQRESAPEIMDNLVETGEAGIFCWLGSTPQIVGNRILGHAEEGIFVDASSRPTLRDNQVSGNDLGLVLYAPELSGEGNLIRANREDVRLLKTAGGSP